MGDDFFKHKFLGRKFRFLDSTTGEEINMDGIEEFGSVVTEGILDTPQIVASGVVSGRFPEIMVTIKNPPLDMRIFFERLRIKQTKTKKKPRKLLRLKRKLRELGERKTR